MRTLTLITCTLVLLSGCTYKYVLDKPIIEKYKLSQEDLKNIQFYNSEDIVLTRYESSTSEKSTENGTLNLNFGKQTDQIVIKAGTPGKVVRFFDNNKLGISFEPDDSKFIVFGTKQSSESYFLQALEWKDNRGRVEYGNATYYTNTGADHCFVKFKLKKEYREDTRLHVAKGNKL